MKKLTAIVSLVLAVCLLAGCAGSPVIYYTDCTCPAEGYEVPPTCAADSPAVTAPTTEGALKTGLYIATGIGDSKSAAAGEDGEAKYDVTIVAVLVDDNGVIHDCIIDSVGTSVKFDASGAITSDLTARILTKNELGENYGMVAYGNAIAEWDAQADALAKYAVGKDAAALRSGAIDETGYAADADLASSATIYLGGYVHAIEIAAGTAKHLGAQTGDTLKLAVISSAADSKPADAENAGNAQLNVDVAAITMNGETITSCYIDAVQAKVAFDQSGTITSEIGGAVSTKNQLGDQYGMKAWGGAQFEWWQQAESFCAYVTGKTAAEVAGIAVDEGTKPTDADLSTSVTIAIGGFMALIEKAAQ